MKFWKLTHFKFKTPEIVNSKLFKVMLIGELKSDELNCELTPEKVKYRQYVGDIIGDGAKSSVRSVCCSI